MNSQIAAQAIEIAKKSAGAFVESKIIASVERGLQNGDIINVTPTARIVIDGGNARGELLKDDKWVADKTMPLNDAMSAQLLASKAAQDGRKEIHMAAGY